MGKVIGAQLSGNAGREHGGSNESAEVLPLGELVQYGCAVTVGDELNFTRAARRLHMDQSAVSRHIQKLEAKLGIKLFVRGVRGVELTEGGKGFLPYARKSLVSASQGEHLAQALERGDAIEFEVAYSPLVDMRLVAQIRSLGACLLETDDDTRSGPPIRFRSVASEKFTERLFEGTSQAAIGILPAEDSLAKVCILREKLFVALPVTHRLAHCLVVHPADLLEDPVIWVLGAQDSPASKHILDLFRRVGYMPLISREAHCVAEALGLVCEGFGVGFVKASELRLHPEGVVLRPFSAPHLVVETGLLYVPEHRRGFLAEFVSLVGQHLRCGEPEPSPVTADSHGKG
jgi:DNA-binding transcriptional LysR family regulator